MREVVVKLSREEAARHLALHPHLLEPGRPIDTKVRYVLTGALRSIRTRLVFPPVTTDEIAEARKRIDEAWERTKRRIDELNERGK